MFFRFEALYQGFCHLKCNNGTNSKSKAATLRSKFVEFVKQGKKTAVMSDKAVQEISSFLPLVNMSTNFFVDCAKCLQVLIDEQHTCPLPVEKVLCPFCDNTVMTAARCDGKHPIASLFLFGLQSLL